MTKELTSIKKDDDKYQQFDEEFHNKWHMLNIEYFNCLWLGAAIL